MSAGNYSEDQIRQVVREALLEAWPANSSKHKDKQVANNCALMAQILESIGNNCKDPIKVDVDSKQGFNSFIRDLVRCVADKNVEAMILSNRLKFEKNEPRRDHTAERKPVERNTQPQNSKRKSDSLDDNLQSGVLTESKVLAYAKTTNRIVIGSKVVLTPLARDRARTVGLEIVRQ